MTPTGEPARPKRTAAHERAIRRAWAMRKAARAAKADRDCIETTARTYARSMEQRERALQDQVKLAEQIAEDHLRMREDVQRLLRDAEQRLAAAEAENAQLWAEIEALTAPAAAVAA